MKKLEAIIQYYEKERIRLYDLKELNSDTEDNISYQIKYDEICLFLTNLKDIKDEFESLG